MFYYLNISLRGLEVILIPAPRNNGNVVGVVLCDNSPGEEDWDSQLVVKPEERGEEGGPSIKKTVKLCPHLNSLSCRSILWFCEPEMFQPPANSITAYKVSKFQFLFILLN